MVDTVYINLESKSSDFGNQKIIVKNKLLDRVERNRSREFIRHSLWYQNFQKLYKEQHQNQQK